MHSVDRREFLRASTATALGLGMSAELSAQPAVGQARPGAPWDQGALRHVLPTVSDTRLLIKTSFNSALDGAPTLNVGGTSVRGRMGDTRGEHWHFYATDLEPGRRYALSLADSRGRPLAQPWEIATVPGPDERPQRFRVLFYYIPARAATRP
jgi:hypothetical protein